MSTRYYDLKVGTRCGTVVCIKLVPGLFDQAALGIETGLWSQKCHPGRYHLVWIDEGDRLLCKSLRTDDFSIAWNLLTEIVSGPRLEVFVAAMTNWKRMVSFLRENGIKQDKRARGRAA